ncbi:MAG: diguanylate cyclase [Mycobacterium sp.]
MTGDDVSKEPREDAADRTELDSAALWTAALASGVAAVGYTLYAVVTLDAPNRFVLFADVAAVSIVALVIGLFRSQLLRRFGLTAIIAAFTMLQRRQGYRERRLLADASRTDALTGAPNRRGFEERFQASIDQAERLGRPVALLTIDLDSFKQMNDTRGHAAGDAVLKRVANGIGETVRRMDAVGRLGGDEFGIVLFGSGSSEARKLAAAVTEMLRPVIGMSVGVAIYPGDGITAEELFRAADVELYVHKHGGPSSRPELAWAVTLAEAVDRRLDSAHSRDVAVLAAAIAERRGWDHDQVAELRIAAMLHAIGLSAIPDSTLTSRQPLTPDQRQDVDRHTTIGAEMLARVEGTEVIVPWIRHSHERFDGLGTPSGLRGEEIPEASRIPHVVDAYTAMTNNRPYRKAMRPAAALDEIKRGSGTQFDPMSSRTCLLNCRPTTDRQRRPPRRPSPRCPSRRCPSRHSRRIPSMITSRHDHLTT